VRFAYESLGEAADPVGARQKVGERFGDFASIETELKTASGLATIDSRQLKALEALVHLRGSMADESLQFSLEFGNWTTTANFPSWNEIQSRHDLFGAREQALPSDGTVEIVFMREGRGSETLTPEEIASVEWVIENEAAISQALFESLAKDYPDQQEFYEYSDKERAELMPDIESAGDLHALTRLHKVYVHSVQKDGSPYVGFLLGCTWEQEHALGILMHGTRTVEIGWAETAFTAWTAKRDRESERISDESAVPEISSWRASVQRRKQAKQNTSEARQRSAALAAIGKEVGGKPFPDEKFFQDAGAQFSIVGPQISEDAINAVFPESFPGKEDFVQFYLRYNGGSRTQQGCIAYCALPAHRILRSQLDKLSLECFRTLSLDSEKRMPPFSNMLGHHTAMARIYAKIPAMKAFLDEHMEIAVDHTGNDLCLSRQSGRAFFMDWSAYKDGPVEVASSFREFVLKFWNIAYVSLH